MLALVLTFGLFAQGPAVAVAAAIPMDPAVVPVRGEAELSPAQAEAAALGKVEEYVSGLWTARGERIVATQAKFWLPPCLLRPAMDRWLQDLSSQRPFQVVDRVNREREHEFGSSWQTTLWIKENPRVVEAGERQLRQLVRREQHRVLCKSGGTVLFWAVLAFAIGWLDRLSRGYMTMRLWGIGLLLGTAVPALVFVL